MPATPSSELFVPTRFVNVAAVSARLGERVARLGPMLMEGDPLADAAVDALAVFPKTERDAMVDAALAHGIASVPNAPDALVKLFAQLDHVPFWFVRERGDHGGAAMLSSGILGGFVLGFHSLVGGYCSPSGNKPLAFSGRLTGDVARRLGETGRFVQVVADTGGMNRFAAGFAACVKVRLIHASVRRMLLRSEKWDAATWGTPINQVDSAGTVLLFSLVMIDGLRKVGYAISADESEDLLHLWRYAGYVMGVREELLCSDEREARVLFDAITDTQDPPDDDSRRLARALIEDPLRMARTPAERRNAERFVRFGYGFSRYLLGDYFADHLGYPQTPWRFALPAIRRVLFQADRVRRVAPGSAQFALGAGEAYWKKVVEAGLAGVPATFAMPDRLAGMPEAR